MNVALIHAYSSKNSGDGLLVEESLAIARQAFGHDVAVDLFASEPETFEYKFRNRYKTIPSKLGYDRQYLKKIRHLDDYDFVLAVGGGYLRGGTPVELVKMLLVHGPQLYFASRSTSPTMYLPQSIGPLGYGLRPWIRSCLRKIDFVAARDARTTAEVGLENVERRPDLAISANSERILSEKNLDGLPVLSVREIRGQMPPLVNDLSILLGQYESYIQSRTRGNDDTLVTSQLSPTREISRGELLDSDTARVVIAVRLHAALMAIQAGHFVIHLAYERKGFGAFDDLGIPEYVHNVNSFDPTLIMYQVNRLYTSASERSRYFETVQKVRSHSTVERKSIVDQIRGRVAHSGV